MDVKQSATGSLSSSLPILCSTEYGSTDSSPSGEHGSCAENAENIEGDSVSQDVINTTEASSSSVRSTSPDLNCPICLGRLQNRSYTDTCFHKFCFVCLVEWSKVKPVCPLCKQPFTSVIHNVQSYENFEQLPITPANNGSAAVADLNRSRFRYPTTMIRGSSERRRQRESLQRPSRLRRRGSSRFDVPPPAFTSSFRRSIYRDELWVRNVEDSGRYRDASAMFFARNPAAVHRLMPWLNRELMALLRNPADVSFLLEVICSTVSRVDITSETFYDLVMPFIGARTRHFVHEFHTFARSPFNMEAYDTRVNYERPPQIASSSPIEFSDSSSSDSSDADIVEINSVAATNESSQVVNDDERDVSESIFHVVDSEENLSRDVSPQPGPSRLQDIPLPSTSTSPMSRQSHYSRTQNVSVPTLQHPSSSASDGQELNPNMEDDDDDSSDDIEIVSEDKPWRDRSPVVLSSSDSDADNVTELPQQQATDVTLIADAHPLADAGEEVAPIFQHRTADIDSSKHDVTEIAFFNVQTNMAEITVAGSVSSSTHSSKRSSPRSRHHDKRAKKHKHRHRRDSSRRRDELSESHHSSSSGHCDKKDKQRSQILKPDDSISVHTEHVPSTSSSCRNRVSDSRHAENKVWLSDDSSESDDYQPVRSVVVVPQTFKKNATGHKRSTTDQ